VVKKLIFEGENMVFAETDLPFQFRTGLDIVFDIELLYLAVY
jgi:hypothetical protein